MKTGILNEYVDEWLRSIEQALKIYKEDNELTHLHHLRIEIKKIKAVFYFVEKTNKEKYYKDELKSLFHDAGGIRELQMHVQQLDTIPHPPEKLITQLVKKKKKCQKLFRKNIPGYIKIVGSFREKFCLPARIPGKKSIIGFFRKQMNKSKKEIDNKKEGENLHHLRTRLKKIMNIYDILPAKTQSAFELNTGYINKLQKKIGEWHDRHSAICFLSHQQVSAKMYNYISRLKEKEKKQLKSLIKKIKYHRIVHR
ncbi:MAG: hypothetical protein JWP12_398 [Bacteroidetes bacterium]|nr:hypothetical protein [Bacteroidota bacterium]